MEQEKKKTFLEAVAEKRKGMSIDDKQKLKDRVRKLASTEEGRAKLKSRAQGMVKKSGMSENRMNQVKQKAQSMRSSGMSKQAMVAKKRGEMMKKMRSMRRGLGR